MERTPQFDTGWPVALVFGLMAVFILGISHTGQLLRAEFLETAKPAPRTVAPERPEVLVITTDRSDQTRVAVTVNPRGYRVLVAETVAGGQAILRSDAPRIGVVVVDSELAEAETLATLARSLDPVTKLIQLRPNHSAADVALLLLSAI